MHEAVAELSAAAFALLRDVHDGRACHPRTDAALLIERLHGIASYTGADLNDVPAYIQSTTNWRAIARLAGSGVAITDETTEAG